MFKQYNSENYPYAYDKDCAKNSGNNNEAVTAFAIEYSGKMNTHKLQYKKHHKRDFLRPGS